jgi:hypothetical protein
MENNNTRRAFMKTLFVGVSALVLAPVVQLKNAIAAELAKATDPLVKALGYVENAKKITGPDAKTHKKGTHCGNCQFFADATGKAAQAKCQLIASGEVKNEGWCRSYSQRAGSKLS